MTNALLPRVAAVLWSTLIAVQSGQAQNADPTTTLPLVPTRTAKFTVNEGTWMSLDVSPDGKTLVFDLLGDLYTLPITGGKATRITSGMGWDGQPRFSPDGRRIVFISDRSGEWKVWVGGVDGRDLRAVVSDSSRDRNAEFGFYSPTWTADGTGIIVLRSSELMLYRVDGGPPVKLDSAASGSAQSGPSTSADGRYVFYGERGQQDIMAANSRIIRVDLTTKQRRAETPPLRIAYRPRVSPDGRQLAYVRHADGKNDLVVRTMATGEEHVVAVAVQPDLSWSIQPSIWDLFPGYAFTPDGKALVFTTNGKLWRVDIATSKRSEIPFTADVEQHLGPLSKFEYSEADSIITVRQIRYPTISPDGKRIAFSALSRIWTLELPRPGTTCPKGGCVPRRVTNSESIEEFPTWSPDGGYLAYVTWNDVGGGDVYRVPTKGGAAEKLTTSSDYYSKLTYSPDGSRLIALHAPWRSLGERTLNAGERARMGLELISIPANGGERQTMVSYTDFAGPARQASWGTMPRGFVARDPSDNGRLVYFDNDIGTGTMVSIRSDGSDRKVLFRVPRFDEARVYWEELLLSPDGRRILTLDTRGVHLVTVPSPGTFPDTLRIDPQSNPNVKLVSRLGQDFIGWSPDGQWCFYTVAHTLFVHNLANAEAAERAGKPYQPDRVDVTIRVPRDRPAGVVALRGGRIITMRGDEIIENGTIVVRNNRIETVGPAGSVAVPSGARVVDVTGKTLLPGYADLHGHLEMYRPGVHQNTMSSLLAFLAYGVTTVRDPTGDPDLDTYQDRLATGDMVGSRLSQTNFYVRTVERSSDYADVRATLERFAAPYYNAQTVKQYVSGNRRVRQWIIMGTRELGLTPTNEGSMDAALTFVLDGYAGMEHPYNLPSPIFTDVAQLITASGLTYDPAPMAGWGRSGGSYYVRHYNPHAEPKMQRFVPHSMLDQMASGNYFEGWHRDEELVHSQLAADMKKIVEAGGRVSIGSHGDIPGFGVQYELWALASGGMRPIDVLRAASWYGIDAIGWGKELGTLEPGKLADLQVLDRNPLDDIQNTNTIRLVMKNGRLYDANTLDEVWPRERKLPTPWWWTLDPFDSR